jgi:sulfide:quinone oxidoreductase
LIVGGGVAALEAALALREQAGDRVGTTLLAPDAAFNYRPMSVREPFGYSAARSYPLDEIARDVGAEFVHDSFSWLDPGARVVHTSAGNEVEYDALLLAIGARVYPRFKHALTIDDRRLDEQLHGLIQDVEEGYVHKIAFVAPSSMVWPLPIYELALMTARRAFDMNTDVSITIATPEEAPLAVFGTTASETIEKLLTDHGILIITSAHCEVPERGRVSIHPGERWLHVDRVVALPQLVGPSIPGVPNPAPGGFISVDPSGKVRGEDRIYAAGDATDFPVKMGGIAAQQADVAATAIAALAGASVEREPFRPVIHGILLGAEKPLYLSAHITGGHGSSSRVSETPGDSPRTKIAAKYLAPYLEARDRVEGSAS